MFEKYSEKSSRAIHFSRREAGKCGASIIDTCHLLLGVLSEDETRLKRLTGKPELSTLVRDQLEARLKEQDRIREFADLPVANEYQQVLLQAADEARILSSGSIEPRHFLLAMLRVKECQAAKILISIGLTYEALRGAIAEERQGEQS